MTMMFGTTELATGINYSSSPDGSLIYSSNNPYSSSLYAYNGQLINFGDIVLVQEESATNSANGASITIDPTYTQGNTLVAGIGLASGSVVSITDTLGNPWIQAAFANSADGNSEIWYSRGIAGGAASVTAVVSVPSANVSVNVSEWLGLWFVDPLDQWSQNLGNNTTPKAIPVQPSAVGDLFFSVVSAGASVSPIGNGYTDVSFPTVNQGCGYLIASSSSSVSSGATWTISSATPWSVAQACFSPGVSAMNPRFQFPETLVQISTQSNFQAPLEGQGVWTNISSYVQAFTSGPIGRQHELDRVQAAPISIKVDNRDGSFYPWNTNSFLYNGGYGMNPMNPVRIVAAWNGVTYPAGFGYFQSLVPTITDALNVDSQLTAIDIFQQFSLKYLTSDNYAQLIMADSGSNLKAYYRLGDNAGSFSVIDSSGNGNTGSLINGVAGEPAYGSIGAFLYDANTALDLTNGTNVPNGGFNTRDNTQEAPNPYQPLGSASSWTIDCWMKFVGTAPAPAVPAIGSSASVAAIPNQVLLHYTSSDGTQHEIQMGYFDYETSGLYQSTALNQFGFVDNSNDAYFGVPVNVFDGQWHYVSILYDGTVIYVEVDANPNTMFSAATSTSGITAINIGTPPFDGTSNFISGANPCSVILDEVAMYNGVLSQTQMQNRYNYGKWFASVEVGASVGTTPTTSRLSKVVAVMGLPDSAIVCPYPFLTELYAETNLVTTTSALNYIQTTTETEPGLIYQGPDGYIYALNRQYQYINPTSASTQAIFSDSSAVQLHYEGTSFSPVQDDLDVWNDIQVQSGRAAVPATGTTAGVLQEWGPTQSQAMNSSASVYGARTLQGLTSLQQQNDLDALALAQLYASWYGFPKPRVEAITLNSFANGGANIPQMLGRKLFDRITIHYHSQTGSTLFKQDSLVESVTHTVTMVGGPSWSTLFSTSPYEISLNASYFPFTFGDSTVMVF